MNVSLSDESHLRTRESFILTLPRWKLLLLCSSIW